MPRIICRYSDCPAFHDQPDGQMMVSGYIAKMKIKPTASKATCKYFTCADSAMRFLLRKRPVSYQTKSKLGHGCTEHLGSRNYLFADLHREVFYVVFTGSLNFQAQSTRLRCGAFY